MTTITTTTYTTPSRGAENRGYTIATEDLETQPAEIAISLTFNGLSHLVMMASPDQLEDFATGFSLSEGLVSCYNSIRGISIEQAEQGIVLQLEISARDFHRIKQHRRLLQGRSGCGLCGQESLKTALPLLKPLTSQSLPSAEIFNDIRNRVRSLQHQAGETGGMHGAFLLNRQGHIVLSREDIGRHNAMDKLLGAAIRQNLNLAEHCVVLTSRCSIELVQKAVRTGVGTLATFSSPTRLAIMTARQYRLNLIQLPRNNAPCIYSDGTDND
ncbi:formate dehydrogenase accessory sulfurtransferase FdhD [Spongorhabdus nitratireducens]